MIDRWNSSMMIGRNYFPLLMKIFLISELLQATTTELKQTGQAKLQQ
jgi:hypothetical protein